MQSKLYSMNFFFLVFSLNSPLFKFFSNFSILLLRYYIVN